jgi:hypothetical protein
MSLFIGNLACSDPALINEAKIGVLAGSMVSEILGAGVLIFASRRSGRVPVLTRQLRLARQRKKQVIGAVSTIVGIQVPGFRVFLNLSIGYMQLSSPLLGRPLSRRTFVVFRIETPHITGLSM